MRTNALRANVVVLGVSFALCGHALAGNASALDLGSLFQAHADANVQRASEPTDLEVSPSSTGPTHVVVKDPTEAQPGTITVDTKNRYLYLSMTSGEAVRYDIGVGREGFAWSGNAYIARRAEWPGWTPPADMLKRRPDIPHYMSGGVENPLGARAMYLYNAKGDTMYRIHGTNEPDTIGRAVSSGCIRLLNADVIDLYDRVKVGARVVVL